MSAAAKWTAGADGVGRESTTPGVPELDGYVWFGSNTPFQDGGVYIGCPDGPEGYCIEIEPDPKGARLIASRIYTPNSAALGQPAAHWQEYAGMNVMSQWSKLLVAAGIPSGGLGHGTPRALIWDALVQAGFITVVAAVDLYGNGDDIDKLTDGLRRLARQVVPDGPTETFSADVVRTYNIT